MSHTTNGSSNGVQSAKPRALSHQAQKSAEALFQSRNIAGIKEVERQTRRDIEAKKLALKQLVGDSYHDLIYAADVVVEMAASCQAVTENIAHIQEVFNNLALTLSAPGGQRDIKAGLSAEQSELYALASRVKYLVDTPEAVWGYLDGAQPLAAARRHLRAECVYACLDRAKLPTLRKRFPLLKAQYPAIHQQKNVIAQRVRDLLTSSMDLPSSKVVRALATQCLLDASSSDAALALFLATRKQCLLQTLQARQPPCDAAALTDLLVHTAHSVQDTMSQVAQLFMEPRAADGNGALLGGASMLQDAVREDPHSASELMFDPLPAGASGSSPQSEVAAWREATAALERNITPLAVDQTAPACAAWLKDISGIVTEAADVLLAPAATCSQLSEHEGSVVRAIREWVGAPLSQSDDAEERLRWDDVSEAVLGRRAALWPEVFEACLVARASTLVAARFAGAVADLEAPLAECVARAGADAADTPGAVAPQGARWRERVGDIARALDDSLCGVLADVMALMPKGGGAYGGASLPRARSLGGSAAVQERRAALLQQCVQDCLSQSARNLAAVLDGKLTALPAPTSSGVVEQALVIGRLAETVGEESSSLAVILGSPDEWLVYTSTGRLGMTQTPAAALRQTRALKAAGAARLEPIAAAMRDVSRRAFQVWAVWAAEGLADTFAAALAQDSTLRARAVPPNWEEVVVASPDEGSSVDAAAIRFCLPAQPTTATLSLLMRACNELQRAGGACVARSALNGLAHELQGVVMRYLQTALAPSGLLATSISEKGVLQLLFDVRCIRDALASGRPLSADSTASAAAASALRAEGGQLEATLCGMLDPIDWATYEPFLWACQARCMQQKSLIFGLLMQLVPGHEAQLDKLHGQGSKQETFLDLGPSCKHLPLLPIAMPNVQPPAQSLAPTMRAGVPAAPSTSHPQASSLQLRAASQGPPTTDLVEAYSFATLAVHRPAVEESGAAASEGGGMAAAAMSTLESLGARFTDSTAALGSMGIGLDVSAMQQQLGTTFGNVLQPNVLSSSIFSFGK